MAKVSRVSVDVSQQLLDDFFHDPAGEPLREIHRRTNNIQAAIRREAPKQTGRLAATVRKQPPQFGRASNTISITIDVGSNTQTPYLGYILDGTEPHIITPRGTHYRKTGQYKVGKGGKAYAVRKKVTTHALRFVSGGTIVFATVVHHPGTRANDFITRGMEIGFAE